MIRLPLSLLVVGFLGALASQSAEVTCQYPDEARALATDWAGTLAAGYRVKLHQSPDDPATLFLVGVSSLPKDASEAVRDFDQAIAKDPRYPWPYVELIEVYATPRPDPAKLAINIRAYHDLCPANVDAFRYLSRITDRDAARTLVRQFREAIEGNTDPQVLARYTDLWAAEFRSTPPADFEKLRARIRQDLKRLETFEKPDHTLLTVLREGYDLTGQAEAADRAAKELLVPDDPVRAHWRKWNEQHPYSQSNGTPEDRRSYRELERKEAEELAANWPNSFLSWMQMLQTASTADQARQAGEQVMELATHERNPDQRWGAYDKIAASWLRYDIRLQDVPGIAEQALRDLDRTVAADGPVPIKSQRLLEVDLFRTLGRFEIWETLLNSLLRIGETERASRVARDMEAWLMAHPVEPDTPRNIAGFYPRWEGFLSVAQGKVAEAQGRKADALAYYQRVLIGPARQYPGNQVLARAQSLWKELGGTGEGWIAWSKPVEPKPIEPKPAEGTPIQRATAPMNVNSGWTKIDRSLGDLNLSDLNGKMWTVSDLKGKVTLVNVWASWCGPCTAELPHIQELYEKIKGRDDVQLITFSVDENPGLSDLLIKKQHYTFPVLMAESYFAQIQPPLSIPRTWLLDKTGIAHLEKVNSNDPRGSATFVQDALDQLKSQ